MALDIENLVQQMLDIAKGKFGSAYKDAKDFAENEFKKYSHFPNE